MRRRWRLLTGLALLLVGVVLSFPAVHWRLIGWARGEAFYDGRPSSWWREPVRRYPLDPSEAVEEVYEKILAEEFGDGSIWEKWTGPRHPPTYRPLLAGDPSAIRVLTELLNDSDERVRTTARQMLDRIAAEAGKAGIVNP